MDFLNGFKEHGYALMRIVTGYLFLWHGTQKLFDFPNAYPWGELDALAMIGGGIEIVAGINLLRRYTSTPSSDVHCNNFSMMSSLIKFALWFSLPLNSLVIASNADIC